MTPAFLARKNLDDVRDRLCGVALAINHVTKPGYPIEVTLHATLIALCAEYETACKALRGTEVANG